MALKGSKTEDNLKAAFAGESQANRRYLYFAQKADVEGYNDVASVIEPKRQALATAQATLDDVGVEPAARLLESVRVQLLE